MRACAHALLDRARQTASEREKRETGKGRQVGKHTADREQNRRARKRRGKYLQALVWRREGRREGGREGEREGEREEMKKS